LAVPDFFFAAAAIFSHCLRLPSDLVSCFVAAADVGLRYVLPPMPFLLPVVLSVID
jgi:hypothetical protein